ncbi:hypothetical protein EV361DRAFT_896898 [Lentinula raphanica]|nr:hypothetical protein EV361DRAFT_896898 [Lentinula raphanica]
MPSGRSYPSSTMSSTLHSSSFLSLPREIRDNIYETLLYVPIGTPSPSIPVHLIEDLLDSYSYSPDLMFDWNWQTEHAPRGSCFGILYTCRQIYTEIVECFERQEKLGGMSFELDIILRGVVLDWTVLPLCTYPQGFDGSSLISTDRHPKCKNLKNYLDEAHTAGALFDRIRLVRLSLEGVLDTEWLVDQGKTMSSLEKEFWASMYGWVIDADSEERRISSWHKLQKRLNLVTYSQSPF